MMCVHVRTSFCYSKRGGGGKVEKRNDNPRALAFLGWELGKDPLTHYDWREIAITIAGDTYFCPVNVLKVYIQLSLIHI